MGSLVLAVRSDEGRYHGQGDWPPCPMRLFQALVAGAALGGPLGAAEGAALKWLEELPPPVVCAPHAERTRPEVSFYVPNNDSDRVKETLTGKRVAHGKKVFQPYLFDATVPFLYAWRFDQDCSEVRARAEAICSLAERLYQLGRGVDIAWAWGEILTDEELDQRLGDYPGQVFHPSAGASGTTLRCPCPGTLESLGVRHQAFAARFTYERQGRTVKITHRRPPNSRFRTVPYESPPSRQVFELRDPALGETLASWPLVRATVLVTRIRDGAVERLKGTMPSRAPDIERVLVGRKPDGTNSGSIADRVRIIPLASIGHQHVDMQVRRVLVEVPPTCPILADDVYWGVSGLELKDPQGDELVAVVIRAGDNAFARHYGVNTGQTYRDWKTVTPAALPEAAAGGSARTGSQRRRQEERAAAAVAQALRHAGLRARAAVIRVQREPFQTYGAQAEDFAAGTRFSPSRLWHVEVTLDRAVAGPLVIGDGRFLGLGVMAPVGLGVDAHFGAGQFEPGDT